MQTTRANAHPVGRLAAGVLLIAFSFGACGGAAAPTGPTSPDPTPKVTPTPVPGDPGNGGGAGNGGGTDPGQGGGAGGNPGGGGGIVIPVPQDPNENPLFGNANYVVPAPDLANPRAMNVQLVRAAIDDDGTVTADLRWWSGVAPCNQLDHVEIVKDDTAHRIHLTVFEGSGRGDVMCIELAELHATAVDLGSLGSGAWTIAAEGDALAITLEIN